MRIALLGPIGNHAAAAIDLVNRCFEELGVSRVVYVGGDGAFERLVNEHFGAPPAGGASRVGFWKRTAACVTATADAIDRLIDEEESLLRLLRVEVPAEDALEASPRNGASLWRFVPSERSAADPAALGRVVAVWVDPRALTSLGEPSESDVVELAPGGLDQAGLLVVEGEPPLSEFQVRLYDRHLTLRSQRSHGPLPCALAHD